MRKILPIVALLVSLLFVGMLPVVEAPSGGDNWNVRYEVQNVLPEDADPAWTRTTLGTTSRDPSMYHNQLLNITMTGAGADLEAYQYDFVSDTDFVILEAIVNIPVAYPISIRQNINLDIYMTDGSELSIQTWYNDQVRIYYPDSLGSTTSIKRWIGNYTTVNHTYTLIAYQENGLSQMDFYFDYSFVGHVSSYTQKNFDSVRWNCIDATAETKYFEWDYVLVKIDDEIGNPDDDLSDRIDELERELERLRKRLGDSLPEVYVNQTELPTIPSRDGGIDDDLVFVDPYRTIVYSVKVSDSGSDLAFSKPYPTTSDEITVISDEIYIAPISYTRLWINDTAGAGTELLNVSTDVTYYNIEWGYAITVQTSGASSSVRADRVITVRLIDSFNWGWNRDSGFFGHTSTISNSISYNMENVRCYWAFPTEDSDGRDVQIDVASIEVWDEDNNLQLDKGRHYEATEAGGVSLEYRWVNTTGTSASRTIRIQFTRARDVQGEAYYTIYDGQIAYSDKYGDAPYVANVHHTQHGTANFEGKIIVKFDLSGQYAGNHLDVRSLKIKRSDSSLFQEFTYDSISNELRITDQTVDAGESITYTLYFDWYDEKSAVYELILGDPLILYSLLLLAGSAGLFIFLDAKSEEKRRKYAGIIIIVVDVAILIIILVVS